MTCKFFSWLNYYDNIMKYSPNVMDRKYMCVADTLESRWRAWAYDFNFISTMSLKRVNNKMLTSSVIMKVGVKMTPHMSCHVFCHPIIVEPDDKNPCYCAVFGFSYRTETGEDFPLYYVFEFTVTKAMIGWNITFQGAAQIANTKMSLEWGPTFAHKLTRSDDIMIGKTFQLHEQFIPEITGYPQRDYVTRHVTVNSRFSSARVGTQNVTGLTRDFLNRMFIASYHQYGSDHCELRLNGAFITKPSITTRLMAKFKITTIKAMFAFPILSNSIAMFNSTNLTRILDYLTHREEIAAAYDPDGEIRKILESKVVHSNYPSAGGTWDSQRMKEHNDYIKSFLSSHPDVRCAYWRGLRVTGIQKNYFTWPEYCKLINIDRFIRQRCRNVFTNLPNVIMKSILRHLPMQDSYEFLRVTRFQRDDRLELFLYGGLDHQARRLGLKIIRDAPANKTGSVWFQDASRTYQEIGDLWSERSRFYIQSEKISSFEPKDYLPDKLRSDWVQFKFLPLYCYRIKYAIIPKNIPVASICIGYFKSPGPNGKIPSQPNRATAICWESGETILIHGEDLYHNGEHYDMKKMASYFNNFDKCYHVSEEYYQIGNIFHIRRGPTTEAQVEVASTGPFEILVSSDHEIELERSMVLNIKKYMKAKRKRNFEKNNDEESRNLIIDKLK